MTKVLTAANLTSRVKLEQIEPSKGRVLVTIKSWPAQSQGGVFLGTAASIIRGEQYVTIVEAVAPDVTIVKVGDIVITSMYSGNHVAITDGQVKMLHETDILTYKPAQDMKQAKAFDPATFTPGINYILVKLADETEVTTASGIVTNVESVNKQSKTDAASKVAEVIAVGAQNENSKGYTPPVVGSHIILDSFVGLKMNSSDIMDKDEYRVMYIFDILGSVKQ